MSSNITLKRLGDVVNFKRGYDLPERLRETGPYPVISSSGISGFHSEFKAEGEGLITGRYGTLGEVYYVNGKYWPHNTTLYVTDFKGNYPKYVYYLLKCLGNLQPADKSTVPGINRNDLHEVMIPYAKRPLQEALANCLSVLDAKIDLNNQISFQLEAMAKTIYDYWFVQFDFPISKEQAKAMGKPKLEGKPYRSSGGKMVWSEELKREVPEGWEVMSLDKRIDVKRGISYASSDLSERGIPMINLNSFSLNGTYKPDGLKHFSGKYSGKGAANSGDLLIAATDVTRNADIIGKAILVPYYYRGELVYSMDVAKIIPLNGMTSSYLLMLFNSEHYHNYIKHYASGTLVLHLNIDGVRWYKTQIPDSSLLKKFHDLYTPIATRISATQSENQKLIELRDWLLPMLMNGQIRIKDAKADDAMILNRQW